MQEYFIKPKSKAQQDLIVKLLKDRFSNSNKKINNELDVGLYYRFTLDSYSGYASKGFDEKHSEDTIRKYCNNAIEITLEEFVDLMAVPESQKVKLNNQYTAIVTKDKIVVGCQQFDVSILEELNKAANKFK